MTWFIKLIAIKVRRHHPGLQKRYLFRLPKCGKPDVNCEPEGEHMTFAIGGLAPACYQHYECYA